MKAGQILWLIGGKLVEVVLIGALKEQIAHPRRGIHQQVIEIHIHVARFPTPHGHRSGFPLPTRAIALCPCMAHLRPPIRGGPGVEGPEGQIDGRQALHIGKPAQ